MMLFTLVRFILFNTLTVPVHVDIVYDSVIKHTCSLF